MQGLIPLAFFYEVCYHGFMLKITVPIYYKDYVPRARKNPLIGMNWLLGAANTFKSKGNVTSTYALTKKVFHQLVADHKKEILSENGGKRLDQTNGYHVHYKIYLKRKGTDGHNVRSAMEKMILDALETSEIIDNDTFVYTTSSEFYLDRVGKPRCEIEITAKGEDYIYEIKE